MYTCYTCIYTIHTPLNTLYTPYIHHCRYAGLRHISQLYLDTNRLSGSIPGEKERRGEERRVSVICCDVWACGVWA